MWDLLLLFDCCTSSNSCLFVKYSSCPNCNLDLLLLGEGKKSKIVSQSHACLIDMNWLELDSTSKNFGYIFGYVIFINIKL